MATKALRAYAKQAGYSLEMQNQCAEIKIRAERKAGDILIEQIDHRGGKPIHDEQVTKDYGISYTQSHRWQNIASIPEEVFEKEIQDTIKAKEELISAEFLIIANKYKIVNKYKKSNTKK